MDVTAESGAAASGDLGAPDVRADLLACPHCTGGLTADAGALVCAACDREYPIVDGIPCFAPTDSFYDSYADEHCPYHRSPQGLRRQVLKVLPFWSYREWKFLRRTVPRCHRLLDIGCGRGRELFADRADEIVGYDASLHFARDCARNYTVAAVGDLPDFPMPSAAFDAVVSSHLLGHVSAEHKEDVVAGIARVLRPGGVSVHIIETDSEHPMVVAAKQHPDTYRRQFVEQDGHIGLEPVPAVVQRFARHGLDMTGLRLVDAVTPSLLNFRKYFDHPDFGDVPGAAVYRRLERWESRSRVVNAAYEVGMGLFHQTVEQWIGDPRKAQFILIALEKTRDA